MAEQKSDIDIAAPAATTTAATEPSKAELQRQMEEARESISETMAEIKETVAHQYDEVRDKFETVKESVSEVLDWREQFKENPIAWGAGAVSVGILIGIGLTRTLGDASASRRRGQPDAHPIADLLLEKLSGIGDAVLPTISASLKEMFGVDLADYLNQPAPTKTPARKSRARKTTARKRTTKQPTTIKKSSAKKQRTKRHET